MSGPRLALIQLHLAVLLAGGSGLFAKLLPVGPDVLTAGRTVFGTAAVLTFATLAGRPLAARPTRDALGLLLCGAALAAHWMMFFLSIQVSTVAVGLLAFSTFPLFTTLLEPLAFGERLRRGDVVLALLVCLGLALIVPSFDLGDGPTRGVLWGVLSALLYAVLSLATRSYNARQSPLAITFHQQLGAALVSVPFAATGLAGISQRDWLGLAVLGIVFTALGQGLVVACLRHLKARAVSVVFGLEPVYAIALAWYLLHETPAPRTLLGGVIICSTACAVTWSQGKNNSSDVS
ncbi:DMT family transporter [Paludisphaera sp.]|uniref:DMT family transporter n=1 Tax=Paludisphaera sp. TaxID=2017432 RepID=UPI00301CC5CD